MAEAMVLGGALAEEAILTHIKVETTEATIAKTDQWEHLAHVAFRLEMKR
jgi:hypothetical protein